MKRATMEDIKNHDWFKKDIPAYLFPPATEADASTIDAQAVKEVCDKFQVQEREVNGALLSCDPHDQLAIAYNLIVDNKRIEDETSKLEIKDFYVASSPPPPAMMLDSPSRPQSATSNARQRITSGGNSDKNKNTPMKRAKWHLGIRSQSKPHDIMNEVYRAMKQLDFEWKTVNAFHVRARRKSAVTEKQTKMSLQLYQVDYKSYLLDFKSLACGDTSFDELNNTGSNSSDPFINRPQNYYVMEFFEMCAALITQLAR